MGTKTLIFVIILSGIIIWGVTLGIYGKIKEGKKVKGFLKDVLIAFAVIFAVGIFPLYFAITGKSEIINFKSKPKQEKVYTDEDKKTTAYVCAKFEVKENLKAPSTAKFQSFPDAVIYKEGSYFVVEFYVDSQNSFGAMIRTDFKCKAFNPMPNTGYCQTVNCTYQDF